MRIATDIPVKVAKHLRANPDMSRNELVNLTGVTEYMAKIYIWLYRNGRNLQDSSIDTRVNEGTRKALILYDIHWPYHDEYALNLALEYGVKLDPDMLIVAGDAADNYSISSFKKDPWRTTFRQEIEAVKQGYGELARLFPQAEKVALEGNHELRMRDLLRTKAQELIGLRELEIPELYDLEAMGWKYVSNTDRLCNDIAPLKLGKLNILHGHEVKVNYSVVNIPRVFYFRTHVNTLVGHYHRTQEHIERKLDGTHEGAWSTGALCKLSPEYAPANNWNHGFAVVEWDSEGFFRIENFKIIGGKIL